MIRHIYIMILLIAAVLFVPGKALSYDLERKVREFTLDNGMKWLFVRRPDAPVFSGVIMVRVGGADEVPGKTGIAHMFEHMAFKGSVRLGTKDFEKETVILDEIEKLGESREIEEAKQGPDSRKIHEITKKMAELEKKADAYRTKNEIWEVLIRNGADGMNAFTAKDITAYFASMPANRLDLWSRVFADMIFEPVLREFYIERNVVADERRSLTENNPDGEMGERVLSAAFKDGPYHWSTIGFMDDINNLTIADARRFHEKYYVASNMVGVLVGDISFGKAKGIIKKVFGKYPEKPVPPSPDSGGEHRSDIVERFRFDAEPSLAVAYHKPTLPNPAEYAFDVIAELMCEGRSSRLKRHLIYERRMIQDIYCTDGYPGSRLDNLFLIWIDPMKGYSLDTVLNAVNGEFQQLQTSPVGEDELKRVRKQVTSGLLFALDDNMSLALGLARFQTIFGDWRILADYPKMVSGVTADDVMRIANKYMSAKDRIVVERSRSHR